MSGRGFHSIGRYALLACLLAGCAREPVPESAGAMVALPLSLSFSDGTPQTRLSDDVAQSTSSSVFRGIEKMHIIPFNTDAESVSATDYRWSANLNLPQRGIPANTYGTDALGGDFEGLLTISNAHLYDVVYIPVTTNRVLVYGKSLDADVEVTEADSMSLKRYNGVLVNNVPFEAVRQPQDLVFNLEPFLSGNRETSYIAWRKSLVNSYLNPVVQSSCTNKKVTPSVTYRFNNPDTYNHHPALEQALTAFTNAGKMMVGSDESLNVLLTNLYRAVYPYSVNASNSMGYNVGSYFYVYELAKDILTKINKSAYVSIRNPGPNATITLLEQAPAHYGLPYGVFPLQFREGSKAFGETIASPGGVGMTDVTKFSYPPSLWYYTESPLATSSRADVVDYYKSSSGAWSSILSHYESSLVQSDSKAAAVRNPVQYGVARFTVKMNKTPYSTVADSRSNSISVVNNNRNNLPLTGIIIADQYPVAWDFTPLTTGESRYIYDNEVNAANGTPKAYISYGTTSQEVSVLVLESPAGQNVHFALEFQNKSNTTIYGVNDCAIFPGMHFYLIGYLNYSQAINTTGKVLPSVFVQDHRTLANISVPHIRNAYSVLPDLSDPQLVLGVDAQVNWIMTTPESIPIK